MQAEVFPAWTNFLDKPTNPLQKILWLQVMARLKPGVTLAQAQSSINLTQRQIREQTLRPFPRTASGNISIPVLSLWTAAGARAAWGNPFGRSRF